METATNIYGGQILVHWGTSCSCVGSCTTKADDALSHWCNQNLHPCAQDLKQAQQQLEWSLEKSQHCPQAPLSSAHLPVKTSEPRLISDAVHPNPHIALSHTHTHTRTCFCTRSHRTLNLILRHTATWSGLCQLLKLNYWVKWIHLTLSTLTTTEITQTFTIKIKRKYNYIIYK